MFKKSFAVLALAVLASMSLSANAALITGNVSFGGAINPVGGATLGSATGVDVLNGNMAQVILGSGTGDLASVVNIVTYNDFSIAPFVPVLPLWEGDVFSFDLLEATVVTQTDSFLDILGSGIMHGVGFDDTAYMWSFSADSTGNFAFSTTNAPAPSVVPEPATLSLLGLGVLGLMRVRRRRV